MLEGELLECFTCVTVPISDFGTEEIILLWHSIYSYTWDEALLGVFSCTENFWLKESLVSGKTRYWIYGIIKYIISMPGSKQTLKT